ncbi:MAG: amidohydrolase family protein [Planctomycetes bacterium]|nr:amidohydrolase family protein [Planctomycetota bacterium]
MSRTWIDTHIHVSDIGRDGKKREQMLEDLLDVLDRCDADLRFVISCDGPYYGHMVKNPEAILRGNKMIYDLCRQAPDRLYGACMINPNFPDESIRVMDACFGEWGFVMLGEMLQYSMKYDMDSDVAETVVRKAVEYDVPVQVHLGTYWHKRAGSSGAGMDHMGDLLGIAERVPEAKYVLAHAIGCGPTPDYVPWADMFLDTIQGYFEQYPDNFWIEIRDFQCKALPRTVAEVPSNRLLAGTDWTTRIGPPFQTYGTMFDVEEAENPFPAKVASFVGFLRDAGASDTDVSRIGFENAKELFRIRENA